MVDFQARSQSFQKLLEPFVCLLHISGSVKDKDFMAFFDGLVQADVEYLTVEVFPDLFKRISS